MRLCMALWPDMARIVSESALRPPPASGGGRVMSTHAQEVVRGVCYMVMRVACAWQSRGAAE